MFLSSPGHASSGGAGKRPQYTCTWVAPTHGTWGHTTGKECKKGPNTSSPGNKALWAALWRSVGAKGTGVFCSELLPDAAEAQLCTITRYNPPRGPSVDEFLPHLLRLGYFAWELGNHRLEQLLRTPQIAAAQVHRWLTVAEGLPTPLTRARAGILWPASAW